ncbi:hypothetical protein [uncultured Thermomonospora sp.]|uniref:hypothetical protein n=1 Tax=uncultured Thermomonospora sp. TaxID=671175 RepID=UPI00259B254A|nr:hypothetical protein [uncultured Thermomonospora sp.]
MKRLQHVPPSRASGPAERTAADVFGPDAVNDLECRTGGRWVFWYGHYTRRWWAMPRPPYPWFGLTEGRTPADLLARVREVEKYYGPCRPRHASDRVGESR